MSQIWSPQQHVIPQQPDVDFGVCVWRLDDGTYLANEDGDLLCAQGKLGSATIEKRMREAVAYYFELAEGEPKWVVGARKVSNSEYEDQMEALQDGHTPDPVDLYRQVNA